MHHINNNSNNTQEQDNFPISIIHNEKALAWRPIMPAPEILTQLRLNEIIQKVANDKKDIPQNSNGKWQFATLYRYTGEHNIRLYYRLRFHLTDAINNPIKDETGKIIKTFRPLTYGSFGDGQPNWYMKNPPYLPLYHLNQIFEYPEKTIVFVEGEQTADSGDKLCGDKYIFTTTGGATSAKNADFTALKDRNILIIPDNDRAGNEYADTVAKLATKAGACSVYIVKLPKDKLPSGWDIADEFPEGITIDDLINSNIQTITPKTVKSDNEFSNSTPKTTKSNLQDQNTSLLGVLTIVEHGCRHNMIVRACGYLHNLGFHPQSILETLYKENALRFEPPLDREEIENTVYDVCNRYKPEKNIWQEQQTQWSPIISLSNLIPEVAEMTPDYVPELLRPYIINVCERLQVSIETVLPLLLSSVGGLIGNRIGVAPRKKDDWFEVPNIWAMIVLPSGSMKTAILKKALKFILELHDEMEEESKANLEQYKREMNEIKKNKNNQEFPDKPADSKLITNSISLPALIKLHTDNPHGIMNVQDELAYLLTMFLQPGHETDRSFFLTGWSGTESFSNVTISRGTDYVPHLCLSIIGCIQNDKFRELFKEFLINKNSRDGFLPRFQILLEPKISENWEEKDLPPDLVAEEKIREILYAISKAKFSDLGYKQYDLQTIDDFIVTRFTPEAQKLFDSWLFKQMNFIRSEGKNEDSLVIAYLSKIRKTFPSLALIFQLLNFFDPENEKKSLQVNEKNLLLALKHIEYYEKHARRLFETTPIVSYLAHDVIQKIQKGKIYEGMSVRDFHKKGWSKLKSDQETKPVFNLLQEHNYIRIEELQSGGRPSQIIRINPDIFTKNTDMVVINNNSGLDIPKTHQDTKKSTISNDLEGLGFE